MGSLFLSSRRVNLLSYGCPSILANRRFARIDEQPQNHKLTCLEERKRLPIDRRQNEGSYIIAFFMDTRDSHLSKSGPRRRLFLIGESRIPPP